jgi:hypothetical protein
MPTPFESAQLCLKLFELRREPVLREARKWWGSDFAPETLEELVEITSGDRNAYYRMVAGYWDMAASMVTFGAIDPEMFRAANGEIFSTAAKIYPFLAQLRERSGYPDFFRHAEAVAVSLPGGPERLNRIREQFLARKKK